MTPLDPERSVALALLVLAILLAGPLLDRRRRDE